MIGVPFIYNNCMFLSHLWWQVYVCVCVFLFNRPTTSGPLMDTVMDSSCVQTHLTMKQKYHFCTENNELSWLLLGFHKANSILFLNCCSQGWRKNQCARSRRVTLVLNKQLAFLLKNIRCKKKTFSCI